MKIGILTSGGDCPGLNAVIRGAVIKGDQIYGVKFAGILDGYRGLAEGDMIPLPRKRVRGLSFVGGTILGTSRTNPYERGGLDNIKEQLHDNEVDAIIAIGGEGTLSAAKRLADDGIHVVGVPKTIDNDVAETDYTFGFDTAVAIATESIDRLRTTAESHHRCMVVEVMGRHVGWIALHAGIAGGAHASLLPEFPVSVDQICVWVNKAKNRGRAPVIVVAEGFKPLGQEGETTSRGMGNDGRMRLGGIGEQLAPIIESKTGIETRAVQLGHLQRGGVPTARDRVLATRYGTAAIDAVMQEKWGHMVALHGEEITTVDLHDATTELKSVPRDLWDEAGILFG